MRMCMSDSPWPPKEPASYLPTSIDNVLKGIVSLLIQKFTCANSVHLAEHVGPLSEANHPEW